MTLFNLKKKNHHVIAIVIAVPNRRKLMSELPILVAEKRLTAYAVLKF